MKTINVLLDLAAKPSYKKNKPQKAFSVLDERNFLTFFGNVLSGGELDKKVDTTLMSER